MPIFYTDEWNISYDIRFKEAIHSKPHVHISYKETEASIAIEDLEVLAGNVSSRTLKRARNYIKNNQEKLLDYWDNAKKGINYIKE